MTNTTTTKTRKRLLTLVITLIMLCIPTMTVFARSEVRSLNIKVKSTGDLSLPEVTESSNKYDITSVTWDKTEDLKAGERVTATVTVTPLDDYEILLRDGRKSISISGTGAELYKYERDGENFILQIDYIIRGDLEAPEEAWWDENNAGVARCEKVENADEYKFILYKDSKKIAEKTNSRPKYDFAEELAEHFYDRNKKDFYFKVRVTSDYGNSYRSEYIDSEYFDQWTDLYYYCKDKGIKVNQSGSNSNSSSSTSDSCYGPSYVKKNGWRYESNGWYFYNNDGSKLKGWLLNEGVWYYLDPGTGIMLTGWQYVNGQWYYLNSSGAMQKGWFLDWDNRWYYLNESYSGLPEGAMCKGWWHINNKNFYMYQNGGYYNGVYVKEGEMARNTTIDGRTIDSQGIAR